MNNKPEPKFVPGERVVICSMDYPQCTGTYVDVVSVNWNEDWDVFEYGTIPDPIPDGRKWGEYSLRKLPPNTPTTFADCIFKPEKVTA